MLRALKHMSLARYCTVTGTYATALEIIWQFKRMSGSGVLDENKSMASFFCTENSAGYTLPHMKIPPWPEIRDY